MSGSTIIPLRPDPSSARFALNLRIKCSCYQRFIYRAGIALRLPIKNWVAINMNIRLSSTAPEFHVHGQNHNKWLYVTRAYTRSKFSTNSEFWRYFTDDPIISSPYFQMFSNVQLLSTVSSLLRYWICILLISWPSSKSGPSPNIPANILTAS